MRIPAIANALNFVESKSHESLDVSLRIEPISSVSITSIISSSVVFAIALSNNPLLNTNHRLQRLFHTVSYEYDRQKCELNPSFGDSQQF